MVYFMGSISRLNSSFRTSVKALFNSSPHCSNVLFDTFRIPSFSDLVKFRSSIAVSQLLSNSYTRALFFSTVRSGSPRSWVSDLHRLNVNVFLPMLNKKFELSFATSVINDSLHTLLSRWDHPFSRKQYYDLLHSNIPPD